MRKEEGKENALKLNKVTGKRRLRHKPGKEIRNAKIFDMLVEGKRITEIAKEISLSRTQIYEIINTEIDSHAMNAASVDKYRAVFNERLQRIVDESFRVWESTLNPAHLASVMRATELQIKILGLANTPEVAEIVERFRKGCRDVVNVVASAIDDPDKIEAIAEKVKEIEDKTQTRMPD